MQHLKELEKFKEKKKSKINSGVTTIPSCVGLKGGAPTKKMKLNQCPMMMKSPMKFQKHMLINKKHFPMMKLMSKKSQGMNL